MLQTDGGFFILPRLARELTAESSSIAENAARLRPTKLRYFNDLQMATWLLSFLPNSEAEFDEGSTHYARS